MAQDDHGQQSHDDSSVVPPAPKTASPPVASAGVASAASPSPPPPQPPPPSAAAAPAAADPTGAQVPTDAPPASSVLAPSTTVVAAAPEGSSASTPAASASPAASVSATAAQAVTAAASADPQQNGDHRAFEPETRSDTDMSSQHPGAPHGLPVSYPGPPTTTYPSVAGTATTQYASYPTVTTSPADAYRSSPVPVGSNAMSLPSMRTIDSMPQQPTAMGGPPHGMGMNMPLSPMSGGMPLYGHPGMGMSPAYGLPSDPMARYALPHDPRLLGHRGPKKEIKRRTKTGCLTCRKRRIKCDETHPTCNNCKKSKRDCLGYDPIFRQQSGSGNIQPAPSGSTPPSTLPSSVAPSVPVPIPSSGPVLSSGPTAAAPVLGGRPANSYGSQPSMLPSSYAAPPQASPTSAIPPAVAAGPVPVPTGYDSTPAVKTEPGYEYQGQTGLDPAIQPLPSNNSQQPQQQQAALPESSRPLEQRHYFDNSYHLRAKKMKINEIIDLLGQTPPVPQVAPSDEMFNEIIKVYHEMYAPGLGAFFETGWYYFSDNGQMTFPKEPSLVSLMASFLKILEGVRANDHAQMASSGILETRIVWELSRTPYNTLEVPSTTNPGALPIDGDANEARNRVHVVEALLCGDHLPSNPLTPPYRDVDPHRTRQFDFWYNLAEFARHRPQPTSPEAVKARDDALGRMRHLLDGRENRDVLYSIAVVRELAPLHEPNYAANLPQHLDETDPRHRLAVASKFLLDESQSTGGTTNVVRRFSDIATRAFVNPGVNVMR